MNLRICCDAFVNLQKFLMVENVEANIKEYSMQDYSLTGNVSITGKYKKDDMEKEYFFDELVPFTVVFKNQNYKIVNLGIDDFHYYEVVNQGLECNFEIVVDYQIKTEEDNTVLINKEKEIITTDNKNDKENDILNVIDTPNTIDTTSTESISYTTDQDDEALNIKDKYDELLKNVFQERDEIDTESNKQNISTYDTELININPVKKNEEILKTKNDKEKVRLASMKESRSTYRVYYCTKENQIDQICVKENISPGELYNDNANKDFSNKRRIIIKK